MDRIYRFDSQEFLEQDFHPTQGVNETYGAFSCRVSGFQAKFAEPEKFLRRMNSGSSNSPRWSFKDHFGYASSLEEHHSLPAAQSYYFHMREDALKQASSHNNGRAGQALIEQPEIQGLYWERSDNPKKTVFQRMLNFLTRCFTPCIKVKK